MATDEAAPATIEEPLATDSAPEPAPVPRVLARPVEPGERVASVDVLRGVALLGILAMNIVDFAWPNAVYSIPILAPGAGPLDTVLWAFNHLIFDTKMMTLFSMLFGAGLVLMSDRAAGRGARLGWTYYRRSFWLLVIGLAHAYLIWGGDILVMYASCAFLLFPFRRLSPRKLIITGVAFNLVLVPLLFGFRFVGVPYMRDTYTRVEAQLQEGKKPSGWNRRVHDGWRSMTQPETNRNVDFQQDVDLHRGPYAVMVRQRAVRLIGGQTIGFLLGGWWFAGGRMLIGMGLMKLGVLAASCSRRTYMLMMLLGYGIGLPLMAFDAWHEITHDFFLGHRLWYVLDGWPLLNFYGSLPVVFGHIGAVMLVCQSGLLTWLTRRLASVGRMALSNYLFDSLLCTTIFYGYGLDAYATIQRPFLWAIVLAIWLGHLLVCPLWLERFRFGPAEWIWRSLTYWKLQPVLVRTAQNTQSAPSTAPLPSG